MNTGLLFGFSLIKEDKTSPVTREFNATIQLVWKAWTIAEHLDPWWGPQP